MTSEILAKLDKKFRNKPVLIRTKRGEKVHERKVWVTGTKMFPSAFRLYLEDDMISFPRPDEMEETKMGVILRYIPETRMEKSQSHKGYDKRSQADLVIELKVSL
jgi:hypothetical protein